MPQFPMSCPAETEAWHAGVCLRLKRMLQSGNHETPATDTAVCFLTRENMKEGHLNA